MKLRRRRYWELALDAVPTAADRYRVRSQLEDDPESPDLEAGGVP